MSALKMNKRGGAILLEETVRTSSLRRRLAAPSRAIALTETLTEASLMWTHVEKEMKANI